MSGALVRGGPGTEIRLYDILPPHLRSGLASRERVEPIAREYEARHPGAVVVCDWELFDDADIATMPYAAREIALTDRRALAERRAVAAKVPAAAPQARGGDPDRNRELLRRAKGELAALDIRSSAYKQRFGELTTQVHQLEDALEIPQTPYKLGADIESPTTKLTEARRQELQQKVNQYRALPTANRRESIRRANDLMLSQMLFDVESEQKLRDLWAIRITELEALAPV